MDLAGAARRWGWPLGIPAGALALRLALFTGLQGGDDTIYSDAAYALASGTFKAGAGIFEMRLGCVAPVALLYALFGVRVACLMAVPLASSLLLVILAYRFGKEMYSVQTGRAAAIFVALLPMDVFHATDSHADLPQAAFATAGLYLLWTALRMSDGRGALLRSVGAGVLFGAAHLTKESAFVLLIPTLLWWKERRHWRLLAVAMSALVAVIGAETIAYGFITGDPLRRFHAAVAVQEQNLGAAARPSAGFWGRIVEAGSLFLNPLDPRFAYTAGLFSISIAALIGSIRRDRERSGWVAFWWAGVTLFLCLWPLHLFPYRPVMLLHARVLAPIVVPGALLAGRLFVSTLLPRWPKAAGVGACLWGLLALVCAVRLHGDALQGRAGPEWAYERLVRSPGVVVVADPRSGGMLKLLGRYAAPFQILRYASGDPPPPPGTILFDDDRWGAINRQWDGLSPPPWWRSASPPREIVEETTIPPAFRLRGTGGAGNRVVLSRILP